MTEQDYKDYRDYEEAHARILAKTPERQWREELCPDGFPYFEQEQLKAAEAWVEYWYETHKDHIPEFFKDE